MASKSNLMVSDVPELVAQWDKEKNTEDASSVSAKDRQKKCYWKCPKCEYEWVASVSSRVRAAYKCPCCDSNKAIKKGVNDVLTVVPALASMYDFEKNTDLDIYSEGVCSTKKAFWKCDDCGRSWRTSIMTRVKKENGKYVAVSCPHYNTVKRKTSEVPKVADNPDLFKFWDAEKNMLDPRITASNSSLNAFWKCPECSYEWETVIRGRERSSHKCPCCELNLVVKKGVNDIFTLVPEAKGSYDFEKNVGIDIYTLGIRDTTPLWWKCNDCKRSWKSSVASRVEGKDGEYRLRRCQRCYTEDPARITPVASYPKLVHFWDFEKNRALGLDVNLTSARSLSMAWWKCKICGYEWQAIIKGRKESSGTCPCCESGRATKAGFNDVLTLFPDFAGIYDFDKNQGIDLSVTGIGSKKIASFRCKSCGHEWESKISDRITRAKDGGLRLVGCPVCDNRSLRKMTYAEEYPELDAKFCEELNGCTLASVRSKDSSTIKFWWECPTCKQLFQSRLQSMISAMAHTSKGCPYCAHYKLMPGQSFADLNEELMVEYSEDNTIDPYEVFPNDKRKATWICRNDSNHTWEASFALRNMGTGNCPICSRTTIVPGVNSFADMYPEFVKFWSPQNERTPSNVFYNSALWLRWICPECKGEFGSYIDNLVSKESPCPYCSNRRVLLGLNSVVDVYPECVAQWSPNNERRPEDVLFTSPEWFKWICPTCKGEFGGKIDAVINDEDACPYCDNRRVLSGYNSLADKYPEYVSQWSPDNECRPEEVLFKSSGWYKWVCPDCGGNYGAPIESVVDRDDACPYCSNRRVLSGYNSLADKYPEYVSQWAPDNECRPEDVLFKSSGWYKWVCPDCGGDYKAQIESVVGREDACPYCSDRSVLPGFNSFAVVHPDLMKEWDLVNNYLLADPDQIGERSNTVVWWHCRNNDTHMYPMSVASRVMFKKRHREPCLYCKGRRRKKRHFV